MEHDGAGHSPCGMTTWNIPTARPGTSGRTPPAQRRQQLAAWAGFIERELQQRHMIPAQLACYANVNASTVSVWRHGKALPNRAAMSAVARCFQLPVAYVAEQAGLLPPGAHRDNSFGNDPEWQTLLREIGLLPPDQLSDVKAALRIVLSRYRRRAS